jgi:hypothetical protein
MMLVTRVLFARHRVPTGLVLAALLASTPVHAQTPGKLGLDSRSLIEVRTLAALPPEVAERLGRGKPGVDGIADTYQPFNKTGDVRSPLPLRHFLVAGSNLQQVLVEYERGGKEPAYFAIAFRMELSGWRQGATWRLSQPASSLRALLSALDPSKEELALRKRQERVQRVIRRPTRRDGPLRDQNVSDQEIREIEAATRQVVPGAIVNISGVVAGCACEEGADCSAQVWVVPYRPGAPGGLQLSRVSGVWKVGLVQQWWLEYDQLMAQQSRLSVDERIAREDDLYSRFPVCPDKPPDSKQERLPARTTR